eukprot:CAMPEP_0118934744 /NCGR_PEP_ID=MMETSP1169-20130426/14037_1 /TAXON_ID=36882 /ORGANISM="Pyramimonas obovata, Strain CCMP722" /LENGTH=324 /DNA_ID=CAMNT_0006877677 /DNA_START=133 /DNA_END=1107 /DNA_ORIENTATION=+
MSTITSIRTPVRVSPAGRARVSIAKARQPAHTKSNVFGTTRPLLTAQKPAVRARATPFVVKADSTAATPPETYNKFVAFGTAKGEASVTSILIKAVVAGMQIGFGMFLASFIGGHCFEIAKLNPGLAKLIMGAFGLPLGLLMVVTSGSDLFTGNTAAVTSALHEKKVTMMQLMKSWSCSYIGNFIGSVLMAYMVYMAGSYSGALVSPIGLTATKTSLTFTQAFFRGILCNYLVCTAIWQAQAAKDFGGKVMAIWFPVSTFVMLGLEHSVANMFLLPMGKLLGAKVTWATIFSSNLIPVTLGNTVGGALFIGTMYSYFYGSLGKK